MSKILLDMDGVLTHFASGMQDWIVANGEKRLELSKEHVEHIATHPSTCWSMYREDWKLDFKQFDKAVRTATDEGVWLGMDVIEGSLEGVDALHLAGNEIHVVTNPWGSGYGDSTFHDCALQKMGWLSMYAVPLVTLRFGHEYKLSLDLDICIEDRIENVVDFARTGRPAVCHSRPWNDPIVHADAWTKAMEGAGDPAILWSRIIRTDWAGVKDAVERLTA